MKLKIHIVNIFLLLFTVVLLILNVKKSISYARWERVYFSISIGSAEGLPIESNSKFITKKGDDVGLRIKDYGDGEWGWGGSSYSCTFQSPPDSLQISYLSLRERRIYEGNFKLPTHIIDSLYKNVNIHYKKGYTHPHGFGFDFIVGIGPLGYVTVWLEGHYGFKKEIARYYCTEINNWKGTPVKELNDYILNLDYSSVTDSLIRNNIPYNADDWIRKREKYMYYIWIDEDSDVNDITVYYYNRVSEVLNFGQKHKILVEACMPRLMKINEKSGGYDVSGEVDYNWLAANLNIVSSNILGKDTIVMHIEGKAKENKLTMGITTVKKINEQRNVMNK